MLRALRVFPRALTAEWLDDTSLGLRFSLPDGCYASILLRELAVSVTPRRQKFDPGQIGAFRTFLY